MEKIFIRERINIVDYDNNNQDIIFTSSDMDIEGGAINVNLESDVGGWHQLTFDMPAFIIKDGKEIQNPLLEHLFPLAKLKYTKTTKEGDETKELILYFIIQPQDGTRDDNGIVLYNFTCIDYPRHYLSKAKNGITIGEDTLDPKRSMTPNNDIMNVDGKVIYVKAPVQSRTDFTSLTQIAAWGDAKPGAFAYIPSTKKAYRLIAENPAAYDDRTGKYTSWYELQPNQSYTMDGNNPVPEPVWCPDWGAYPLEPDVNNYEYGDIGINDIDPSIVQFYWDTLWIDPDRTIGRYDGVLYQEGSRLLFNVFETLDYEFPANFLGTYYKSENLEEIVSSYIGGTTAYVIETGTVWRYNGSKWEDTFQSKREAFKTKQILKGEWSKLDPVKAYLAPNYAAAYLDYILDGTGWKVGEVDKIMVDNGTVEMDESGVVTPGQVELSTYLYFDNSNAYNAISELCEAFKCYPRFDHVNKTVSLKAVPGEDNGLTYQWRDNLANTRITQDGEKAVSKLWVYGGEDTIGQVTIADCNRMNPNYYLADYTSLQDLKNRAKPKEGDYAKVSTSYTWKQLVSQTLKDGKRLPIVNTFVVGELKVTSWGTGAIPEVQSLSDLPAAGSLGQTVFVRDQNSYYSWFPEGNGWYDTYQDNEPDSDSEKITFEQRYDYENGQWVSKGQFYHWYEPLSPCADNYILDFSYFLDRKLITDEQVNDIKYNYILPISHLNKKRAPLYKQYQVLNQELLNWNNVYDECKIARDAIEISLMSTYAIYQKGSDNLMTLLEAQVHKYPPAANKGGSGWVKAEIVYSDSNAPVAKNYASIKNVISNPKIGDYVRVEDEVAVYYYTNILSYDDTICAYLGWADSQITDSSDTAMVKTYLYSPDGKLEARLRNEGLFQKLRDEELWKDKTRSKLAPWYNPPGNINDVPPGPVSDPTVSSLMYPYYDAQNRYVTEQINMNDALDRIGQIETELTLVLDKIETLENAIKALEDGLREKYGDFIVEGVFTDDTIVWIYNLWYAGLEALQLYHRPLITYELGVVDVSGLPEYRTITSDIYHDIVYRMNKLELVLPNPGDYCYVTDNLMGLVMERANITSVTRSLSNPSQHKITIATVDTNTEDLIGKLVTAANTIYSKEQIYNRSAIINQDGTIAQDSIVGSLDDNSGKVTVMSNNGTVILGDNGITTTDRDDAQLRMKYTGKGIFASTNGGTTWENIVNAGKISIKSLSAGSIDSNTISVTNIGHDASIIIDGKGITAINYNGNISTNPSFNTLQVDPHTSFFLDAQTGNAFFRGMIEAGAGLIGGWTISTTDLHSGTGNKYTAMSSTGDYAFWAGNSSASSAPFSVTHDGKLRATGATVSGVITVTDGSSVNAGQVGGWTADANGLSKNKVYISSTGVGGTVHGHSGPWTFYSHGNFGVTTGGNLHASNACIQGHIEASSGTFHGRVEATEGYFTGAITATSGTFSNVTINDSCSINGAAIKSGTINSARIPNLSASKITSGTMSADRISGGRLNVTTGNGGYLRAGEGTTHPEVSGLNVGSHGVVFGNNTGGCEITGTSSSLNLQGGSTTKLGINGTPDMMDFTVGNINTKSQLNIQGGLAVNGTSGITRTKWKCEAVFGTPWLTFKYGIITDCSD